MTSTSFKKAIGVPLLLVIALLPINICAQINADFIADDLSSCSSFIVQFTNLSTGGGSLTYQWDFGNGNTSTSENPSATYSAPGTYTVTLTISNGNEQDTEIKPGYITVFELPQPGFSVDVTEGCVPLAVEFSDLSNPGSGVITNWLWDFGDGNISTLQNPGHTFNIGGNFDVTLLLTDVNSCQQSLTQQNLVNPTDELPVVDFSIQPGFGCGLPLEVSFMDMSTGNGPFSYSWDFGDGNSSTLQNPLHAYSSSGIYDIELSVTDFFGYGDFGIIPCCLTNK